MSLQTRNVPIEEVQKIQKSLWRQSSAVKDAIRDAAGRVLDHVRSRETFLVEQVDLLERAKFEVLMASLALNGGASDSETEMSEAIEEFAAMELKVESGFRTLCQAIANFGPEMLKEGEAKKLSRERHESEGSSFESDFCVLDDDSCAVSQSPTPRASVSEASVASVVSMKPKEALAEVASGELRSHLSFLAGSPFSDWLLEEAEKSDDGCCAFKSFFGEASRYALDYAFWLKEADKEEEDDLEESLEEIEDAEQGWEKWLHPSSNGIVGGEEEEAFFSEYMRFLRQSSAEDWMKDAPADVTEIRVPKAALNRVEALTTATSSSVASSEMDGWLLKPRHVWHQHHPHHYGECVDSCRVLPEEGAEMEIENIGDLACLTENPKKAMEDEEEDSLSQWILKPIKKVKAVKGSVVGRKNTIGAPVSDWLLEEKKFSDNQSTTTSISSSIKMTRSQSVVDEWLKSTEKELVKGLCRANEPCSGFSGCLSDINCKKGKSADDEEKEKDDDNKEVDGKEEKDCEMDDESDDWVLPRKVSSRPRQEEKINQFMNNYHSMTQDFWLTS